MNWSVIGIYAFLFLMPLVVGGLLRLLLRKLPLYDLLLRREDAPSPTAGMRGSISGLIC